MKAIRLGLLVAVVMVGVLNAPRPASACSCAPIGDLETVIADSQAAFVGTLIETRDPHGDDELVSSGRDVIHVFAVERWIKADLGDVIEVHTAADGASCGLEIWNADNRVGAFLTESGGQLTSHLCAQVDSDVLIAAADGPPVPHPELAPAVVVSYRDRARLTLLAASGELVGTLDPTPSMFGKDQTDLLSLCPGGTHLAQLTPIELVLWDLRSYEISVIHDVSALDAPASDLMCREADGSSVWALVDSGTYGNTGSIYELVDDVETVVETPKAWGILAPGHAVIWNDNDRTLYRFDYETSDTVLLATRDVGGSVSHHPAPSPFDDRTALLSVEYSEDQTPTTTVSLVDASGAVLAEYTLPDEGGYGPTWIDPTSVAVTTFDYDTGEIAVLQIIDTESGEIREIPGFGGWNPAAGNGLMFAINNGHVHSADLATGEVDEIAVLTSEYAWELVAITDASPPGPGKPVPGPKPTLTTTPPLQQSDIVPIAVETPDVTSPGVEATQEVPAKTSSPVWWLLGVVLLAGAAFAYARATRSSNSSSK